MSGEELECRARLPPPIPANPTLTIWELGEVASVLEQAVLVFLTGC